MSEINLDEFSIEQLKSLKTDIDDAIERRQTLELIELRDQIDALIDASPFSLEEVLEARPARKPILPKYQHPDDSSLTWTGRGRKPLWVIEQLENGQTLETLAIPTE